MKIGIISFAYMHAYGYAGLLSRRDDVQLSAIWDDDTTRGMKAADKFNTEFIPNLELFLSADMDAVVVCSENAKHQEHVIAAARAKKPILCEKPIATKIEDAAEMIRACDKEGVILQMAFPMRFVPAVQNVREIVQSGAIGEVVAINGTNHGQMPGGWFSEEEQSGGGAAASHIVHVMDLIRWITNDEVKNVYAELDTRFYEIDVEDCGIVSLEMESGAIATIDPSWSRPKTFPAWGDVWMKIVGTKGTVTVDAFAQNSLYYNDEANCIRQLSWGENAVEGMLDDFLESIKQGRPPSITGEDGLRTLEVVKAAYESNERKQSVELKRVSLGKSY